MSDRVKLPLCFDVHRLKEDLHELQATEWIDHFVKQNYEGQWSVIPLRGPAGATHPVMMIYADPACTDFTDMPFLSATPYFQQVLQSFHCPMQSARLMRLSAGSKINEHSDLNLSAEEGNARIHIPIVTNECVDFRLNGSRVLLQEGECWYLRLSDPHSVVNGGDTDRIHLVIDVKVNPWFSALLNQPQE